MKYYRLLLLYLLSYFSYSKAWFDFLFIQVTQMFCADYRNDILVGVYTYIVICGWNTSIAN